MTDVGGVAADKLRSFIERIERLEEEKATIQGDIKEVFSEAKANGFDTKIMRQVLKLRKMEDADRSEQEQLLDLYKQALGMADSGGDHDDMDSGQGNAGQGTGTTG